MRTVTLPTSTVPPTCGCRTFTSGHVNDLQNSAQKPSGRLSGRVSRAFFGGPLAYQGPRLCGSSLIPLPVEAAHYILGSQIHDSTCYLYVTLYIRVLCYSYVISLRI